MPSPRRGDGNGRHDGSGESVDGSRAQTSVASSAMVGRLDYPLFVVTAIAGTETSGCLAGFVTQCSMSPSRFLVCVSKENHTLSVAERSAALGLHLLGSQQLDLARIFGELTGDHTDKFALVQWHPGETGVPVLDKCAAWVEGPILDRIDLGDHIGHVVAPVSGGGGGEAGELWYSAARHLDPGHPPAS